MAEPGDMLGRLRALVDAHSPRRVLVVVPDAVSARWVESLLADAGPVVGARVLDIEALLHEGARALAGEPVAPVRLLAAVREALVDDPDDRYAAIAEHPSYAREVLRCFVELERAGLAEQRDAPAVEGARDRAMLAAFARFRLRLADAPERWWSGSAPAVVRAGGREVPALARRAAAVALGFLPATTARWTAELLDELGVTRWSPALAQPAPTAQRRQALSLQLSCAGPEVEMAAVARLLRRPEATRPDRAAAVLAPGEAVPRFVARLGHRDVPVRAWVEHRARDTAAAGALRALLRVLAGQAGGEAARREDLQTLLFGPALSPWSALSAGEGLDYPRAPRPGDLRRAWAGQRWSSAALPVLARRLRATAEAGSEALRERGERFADAELSEPQRRHDEAHRLLAAAVERLAGLAVDAPGPAVGELLEDWQLLARAAIHGAEGPQLRAAQVIVDGCAREAEASVAELAASLDHALAFARVGAWVQTRAESGAPPVWVLPHSCAAVLGELPPRLLLTGLERHPTPPRLHGPVSEGLRTDLGLVAESERFAAQLRELDRLANRGANLGANLEEVEGAEVIATWRHRDGAGDPCPPGPWIAGRQAEGRSQALGVETIAVPVEAGQPTAPTAPLERELLDWREQPELARRVVAVLSHEAAGVGPHSGALGVRVVPERPYSASALQRYAELPYRYFVERVLGLGEPEAAGTTAAALLARDQGQVVHRALEAALAPRLAASAEPLELATIADELLTEVLDALVAGYRRRAAHGGAEAIWTHEAARWAAELTTWWRHWQQRLVSSWGPQGESAGESGSRRRPPAESTVPSPFLLASEWSVGEGFELELLGLGSLAFAAAVDRIELDPLRQRLNVCDYKARPPRWPGELAEALRAGTHLQLPLYALAVEQIAQDNPGALGLRAALPVGALRLEYIKRPTPRGSRPPLPATRAVDPRAALGEDAQGRVWTVAQAAAGFAHAFVEAIEAGRFPVLTRVAKRRRGGDRGGDRISELARFVPDSQLRDGGLPPPLRPLPRELGGREVVA